MEKLTLSISHLAFKTQGRVSELSPGQFKILYQFFLVVKEYQDKKQHGEFYPTVCYEDIPVTHGAMKVLMVDIKKILPKGSYENIRGEGYRPSQNWIWILQT